MSDISFNFCIRRAWRPSWSQIVQLVLFLLPA